MHNLQTQRHKYRAGGTANRVETYTRLHSRAQECTHLSLEARQLSLYADEAVVLFFDET